MGSSDCRPNALDVPQVEELVRADAGDRHHAAAQALGVDLDCRSVSVLHAACAMALRKVIKKGVLVEGSISHPVHCGVRDLAYRILQLAGIVVVRVAMYHNVVGSAILLKFGLLKDADLSGTVHHFVVAVGDADLLLHLARRSISHDVNVAQAPCGGNVEQLQTHALGAHGRRIHQHHRPVEEAVFGVELSAERPSAVEMNVVINHHTVLRAGASATRSSWC